ncbi:hypothetical protein H0H93_012446 [Arthromyces matolae]|nr:hypothetical protein H0H93_012446 [Arthromyces matolae]
MATPDNPSHDEINLVRLVRRLDRTASEDEVKKPSVVVSMETWIQAQGMLQKVKAARSLLKNVELELYDVELSS